SPAIPSPSSRPNFVYTLEILGKVKRLRNVMLCRKNVYKTMRYLPTRVANIWKSKGFFVSLELCNLVKDGGTTNILPGGVDASRQANASVETD
ncbi:TPA: hypothetical protein ACKFHZ_003743, partial [Burkholderia multivorans]